LAIDFRATSRYIAQKAPDKNWLLWNTSKNSYALYRMALFPAILSDH